MVDIVPEGDVLAENLLSHAIVQAGTLVENRCGREIVKKKPDEIEYSRGLENRGVVSGRKFTRLARIGGLAAGSCGKGIRVYGANVRRVCLRPARGILFQ